MAGGVLITAVQLEAGAGAMAALGRFYVDDLGFPASRRGADRLALMAGTDSIEFVAAAGGRRPFYHFALLLPGNRYEIARMWAQRHATLLTRPGETSTTFRFEAWDAEACYFADPAGNIVELIAHRGMCEASGSMGPFRAEEIVGISELGLVVADPPVAARALASAGLRLWAGGVTGEDALAFIGRRAHTLILCGPGRGWLPTHRPAECHPVTAWLATGTREVVAVRVAGETLTVDA